MPKNKTASSDNKSSKKGIISPNAVYDKKTFSIAFCSKNLLAQIVIINDLNDTNMPFKISERDLLYPDIIFPIPPLMIVKNINANTLKSFFFKEC